MSFFDLFEKSVSEESKSRKEKVMSDFAYKQTPVEMDKLATEAKTKLSIPTVPGGQWKTLEEHEKEMVNIYSLGSNNNARDLYYDKNSHAGTLGNIYNPKI